MNFILSLRIIFNLIWQFSALLMIAMSLKELEESHLSTVLRLPFFIAMECGLIIITIKSIEIFDHDHLNNISIGLLFILIPSELICFCWCFTEFNQENIQMIAISSFTAFLSQIFLMLTKILETNYRTAENFSASTGIPLQEVRDLFRSNQIQELSILSKEFMILQKFFDNGKVHDFEQKIEIRKCYKVNKRDQIALFEGQDYGVNEKYLLWHGTKIKNVKHILTQGFKLPEHNKGMFGKGIYFADRMSKSAQYCDQDRSGVLFLCEVALGNMYEVIDSVKLDELPPGFHSVKGIGKFEAKPEKSRSFGGRMVLIGRTVFRPERQHFPLKYNEYIIYDPKRVLIKNIVKFNWISK